MVENQSSFRRSWLPGAGARLSRENSTERRDFQAKYRSAGECGAKAAGAPLSPRHGPAPGSARLRGDDAGPLGRAALLVEGEGAREAADERLSEAIPTLRFPDPGPVFKNCDRVISRDISTDRAEGTR